MEDPEPLGMALSRLTKARNVHELTPVVLKDEKLVTGLAQYQSSPADLAEEFKAVAKAGPVKAYTPAVDEIYSALEIARAIDATATREEMARRAEAKYGQGYRTALRPVTAPSLMSLRTSLWVSRKTAGSSILMAASSLMSKNLR